MFRLTRGPRGSATFGFLAMALSMYMSPAHANPIITNGSFELLTNGPGQFDSKTVVTGWTSAGYNFIFASVGAISQTVNGLTIGGNYALTFYWAAAQQQGFTGSTTEQWKVTLGSQEQDTAILDNVNHGFTGWKSQTFTYTATATSELLSFLAVGTPNGVPPFALLDGVSMDPVPEPDAYALIGIGLLSIPILRRLRKRRAE